MTRKIACGPFKLALGGPAGAVKFQEPAIQRWKEMGCFYHHFTITVLFYCEIVLHRMEPKWIVPFPSHLCTET